MSGPNMELVQHHVAKELTHEQEHVQTQLLPMVEMIVPFLEKQYRQCDAKSKTVQVSSAFLLAKCYSFMR